MFTYDHKCPFLNNVYIWSQNVPYKIMFTYDHKCPFLNNVYIWSQMSLPK